MAVSVATLNKQMVPSLATYDALSLGNHKAQPNFVWLYIVDIFAAMVNIWLRRGCPYLLCLSESKKSRNPKQVGDISSKKTDIDGQKQTKNTILKHDLCDFWTNNIETLMSLLPWQTRMWKYNTRRKDFRPSVLLRHNQATPPGIWKGVDWRALVED